MKTNKKQATCSEDELANRIADEILTVCGVKCSRAAMMKGKYPDGEKYVGGRDKGSIAFVVKEHLLAAGLLSPRKTTIQTMKATPMTYGTMDVLNGYLVKEQEKIHHEYLIVCNHLEGDNWNQARAAAYKYRTERWYEIERMKAQLRYAASMSNVNGDAATREFWGVDEALVASANIDTLKTPTQTQSA